MPSAVSAIKSSTVDINDWLVLNNSFLNTQVCADWKVLLGLMNDKQLQHPSISGKISYHMPNPKSDFVKEKINLRASMLQPPYTFRIKAIYLHSQRYYLGAWVQYSHMVGKLKATAVRPWHLVPRNLSGPILSSPVSLSCSCQLTIDHEYFVWNISAIFITAVHLPAHVPAKLPRFTEVLRCRNLALPLQWQTSVGRGLSCITYRESHIWINIIHIPACTHTQTHTCRATTKRSRSPSC